MLKFSRFHPAITAALRAIFRSGGIMLAAVQGEPGRLQHGEQRGRRRAVADQHIKQREVANARRQYLAVLAAVADHYFGLRPLQRQMLDGQFFWR